MKNSVSIVSIIKLIKLNKLSEARRNKRKKVKDNLIYRKPSQIRHLPCSEFRLTKWEGT